MNLYADEDFDFWIVKELRLLGYDVLTVQEGAMHSAPDPAVLARAHALGRVVLTHNRRHFERLHKQGAPHIGIVSVVQATGKQIVLAESIHAALSVKSPGRWCIRVNRLP